MVKDDILDLSMGKIPMLKALMLYVIGIVCAVLTNSFVPPFVSLLSMSVISGCYVLWSYLSKLNQRASFSICFSLFLLFFGYYSYSDLQKQHSDVHYSRFPAVEYIGVIVDEPVVKEKTIRFPVRILLSIDSTQSYRSDGKIMLTVLRDSFSSVGYNYGDKIVFLNRLKPVNPPFNPKEFDYKTYLANKGIEQQALIQPSGLRVLAHEQGNPIISYSLKFRASLIAKFRKYIQDDEAFNVAVALIFGYRSQIDQNTISAFTNTGTIHVLSVSGLHVSLVFALLNVLLFWMDRFPYGKFMKSMVILVAIWAYVILTGMSPPILRAGIMISFFVFSSVINRKQIPLNTLAASAFFILLISPHYLFDVGFQLSYMAILGIILLYPILKNYYLTSNKWINYVLEYVYVSLAAQLFTLPFTLYYFGQFPNYFLLANLFIAIPSTLIMYVGMCLAVIPFEWSNNLFGIVVEWLLNFMMVGLKWMEHLPFSVVSGITWQVAQTILLLVCIFSLIVALNYKLARGLLLMMASVFVMSLYQTFISYRKANQSFLIFYNVRADFAIGYIQNNKAVLYSNLDSLAHSTLQYSVLPNIRQYVSDHKVNFQSLSSQDRQNQIIQLADARILILEKKATNLPSDVDIVLWRKNNYTDLDTIQSLYPKALLIVDASNGEKAISRLKNAFESNSNRVYILKNNFAYVWDGE